MMDDLLDKIITNASNEKLLDFLEIDLKKRPISFKSWTAARHPLNEGGCTFFDDYGKDVPETCKYAFETHHIMINPESGEIFAFHTGRFSIFFQCDFERSELINMDDYRKGFTFDCIRDITMLGGNWAFLENAEFEGAEQEQFKWTYEKIMR